MRHFVWSVSANVESRSPTFRVSKAKLRKSLCPPTPTCRPCPERPRTSAHPHTAPFTVWHVPHGPQGKQHRAFCARSSHLGSPAGCSKRRPLSDPWLLRLSAHSGLLRPPGFTLLGSACSQCSGFQRSSPCIPHPFPTALLGTSQHHKCRTSTPMLPRPRSWPFTACWAWSPPLSAPQALFFHQFWARKPGASPAKPLVSQLNILSSESISSV